MNITWFVIVIALSVVGMAAMLYIEFPIRRRVKAGTADKFIFGRAVTRRLDNELKSNNGTIYTKDYEQMVVAGNSMGDYKIHNGDIVLVKTFDKQSKLAIESYPVVAIKLCGRSFLDSNMKLRKFVGYAYNQEWDAIYDLYRGRVKDGVSREDFIASCSKSYGKQNSFPLNEDNPAIVSETYDESLKRYHYSVHPVDLLYGKVVYVGS